MTIRPRSWMLAGLVTLAVAATAWAAAVDGKWTWTGDRVVTLELKQDGEKLTGTLTRGDQKSEIREGTVKGSNIAFVEILTVNGQERKLSFKGKVEGDTLTGEITSGDRKRDWTATRVK